MLDRPSQTLLLDSARQTPNYLPYRRRGLNVEHDPGLVRQLLLLTQLLHVMDQLAAQSFGTQLLGQLGLHHHYADPTLGR